MSVQISLDPGPTSRLIRRFTDELQQEDPHGQLQRALTAKVAYDENIERVSSPQAENEHGDQSFVPSDEAALAKAHATLQERWIKFQKKLPEDQRQALRNKDPDLKYLFRTVNDAANKWELQAKSTSSGQVKTKFRNFCGHLRDHKNIFGMFPKDDKYFSLFAGALTTVVQAAVNHGELAEQVGITLGDLGEDIEFWNRQMKRISTNKTRRFIIELYVVLFEFLADVFDKWSRSSARRFWTSLNENAMTTLFTSRRERMKVIQDKLHREIDAEDKQRSDDFQQQTTEELKHVRRQLAEIFEVMKTPTGTNLLVNEYRLALGVDTQRFLEGTLGRLLENSGVVRPAIAEAPQEYAAPIVTEGQNQRENVKDNHDFSVNDIVSQLASLRQSLSRHLQAISDMTTRMQVIELDTLVRTNILSWISSNSDVILWIEGPHGVARPSQNTSTGVLLAAMMRRMDISCIQYFAGVDTPANRAWTNDEKLMDMLLSIIMQLITCAFERPNADLSFLQPYLDLLDQREIPFRKALDLMRRLRAEIHGTVVFVIDCFQDLEERDDQRYMKRLLQFLGELCSFDEDILDDISTKNRRGCGDKSEEAWSSDHSKSISKSRRSLTKICFTTDGHMEVLGIANDEGLLSKVTYVSEADEAQCDDTSLLSMAH